jgi:hypothetical protein
MTDPKPIETRYAGCRFRSRLEARTAVFFDALRIEWLYEPEGFEIGPPDRRRRYLPDFYLPERALWVEVKGHSNAVDYQMLADAAHPEHGLPMTLDTRTTWPLIKARVLLLGPLPETPMFHQAISVIGGRDVAAQLTVVCCTSGDEGHSHYFLPHGHAFAVNVDGEQRFPNDPLATWGYGFSCPDISNAYRAARSARFEHGEQG